MLIFNQLEYFIKTYLENLNTSNVNLQYKSSVFPTGILPI